MNEILTKLANRIRERFPRLDIRTDQCEIIRIIAKGVVVGVEQKGNEYTAKFISLESDLDFETTLLKTLSSTDLNDFENRLSYNLIDLITHQ